MARVGSGAKTGAGIKLDVGLKMGLKSGAKTGTEPGAKDEAGAISGAKAGNERTEVGLGKRGLKLWVGLTLGLNIRLKLRLRLKFLGAIIWVESIRDRDPVQGFSKISMKGSSALDLCDRFLSLARRKMRLANFEFS